MSHSPLSNPRREVHKSLYVLLSDPTLPYDDFSKGFILQHLIDVIPDYPQLHPKVAPFKLNDGHSVNLLQANGTISYSIDGDSSKHNTHVTICFPESYPRLCPNVFVTTTETEEGVTVSLPYLQDWNFRTSNVFSLLSQLRTELASKPLLEVLSHEQSNYVGEVSSLSSSVDLSDLLSLSSLPYNDTAKECIKQHLLDLLGDYPKLQVKTIKGKRNEDGDIDLIKVDGTIPYSFHGVNYDVPVSIALRESYPDTRPVVFVKCPDNMVIREDLLNVAPNGFVYISYFRNWNRPGSRNLLGLVSHLSAEFTVEPPLTTPGSISHDQEANGQVSPIVQIGTSYIMRLS